VTVLGSPAAGDTVNVASRLLEVSKQHHVLMAVSEDLYRAAGLPGTAVEQTIAIVGMLFFVLANELAANAAATDRPTLEPH
jgi:class 3 adenylate cyclase